MVKRKTNIFERHPKKTLFLLVIVIVLLIDLITGFALIPADIHGFRSAHPYYHHGLLPNQSMRTQWGPYAYAMFTNSLGFRDHDVREISLKPERFRVLLIGDSHTEGVGVDYEESFAGRLADRVHTEGIEVLNAGAVSYSPKLYYLKTKYLIEKTGLEFDALYVFIDISDIQNEFAYESYQPGDMEGFSLAGKRIADFLRKRSFLYYAIHKLYQERKRKTFYEAVTQQQIEHNNTVDIYQTFFSHFDDEVLLSNPDFHTTLSEWYSDKTLYERWGKKGVSLMTESMQRLVKLCREHQVELTITVHPWRNNIRKGNPDDRHVKYWRQFAFEHQAGFFNFYPVFIHGSNADSMIQDHYLPQDNHWNSAGHKKISDKLTAYLLAQKTASEIPDFAYYEGLKVYELQQYGQAISAFDAALVANPGHANGYLLRGLSRLNLGQFDQAKSDLKQADALGATLMDAGRILRNFSLHQRIYLNSHAIARQPVVPLYIQRGEAYLELKNFQLAQADFHAANRLDTRRKEPYYYLGLIEHRYRDNYKAASTYLNRAIQLDPGYAEAYLERASVLRALGNEVGAQRDLEKARQAGD